MPICFAFVLLLFGSGAALAQPADCAAPAPIGSLPLAVDLSGRPGMPAGMGGQAYVAIPLSGPGYACPSPPPPRDILRGDPGDVLQGQRSPDLLRGPGRPTVRIAPP